MSIHILIHVFFCQSMYWPNNAETVERNHFINIWTSQHFRGCLLVALCLSNMLVYLRDQSAHTIVTMYMLPHWDTSCRSYFLPHPVTVYWHQANQSQCWPYNTRHLTGQPVECQFKCPWYVLTQKNPSEWESKPRSASLEVGALTTRPMRQSGGRQTDRDCHWDPYWEKNK